uniref:Uncharacterized protein n=1 Tax=Panagrolaimus sp. ES5 TaxID=591445 RepID=A0AC34FJN8_9BILA
MSPNAFENEMLLFNENDSSNAAIYENEILKLKKSISKKDLKIEDLEKKNNVFKIRLEKYYKQRNFKTADYVKENDQLNDKLCEVEAERNELKAKNELLLKKLSKMEEMIKKECQKSMKAELESNIYFMKQESDDQIATLQYRIEELESEVAGLEAESELAETIKDDLQIELENSENEKNTLQEQLSQMEYEYSFLVENIEALESQLKSMESLQAELDTVKRINSFQEHTIQDVTVNIYEFVIEKHGNIEKLIAELFQINKDRF